MKLPEALRPTWAQSCRTPGRDGAALALSENCPLWILVVRVIPALYPASLAQSPVPLQARRCGRTTWSVVKGRQRPLLAWSSNPTRSQQPRAQTDADSSEGRSVERLKLSNVAEVAWGRRGLSMNQGVPAVLS